MMTAAKHKWEFMARFRAGAFGWKSQPAILRVRQAVAEITKVAKKEPVLAAEGAIQFIERVSVALAQVDSSSGAIGSAVNHAVAKFADIIGAAKVDTPTRRDWLERLWLAYVNDEIPYIEALGDHWGELCASKEIASEWADRLVDGLRENWTAKQRRYYKGTPNCLGSMVMAERYGEVMDLLKLAPYKMWDHCQFGVKALVAQGKIVEAVRFAEEESGQNAGWTVVAQVCEDLLLSAGMVDEAYQRYGVSANRAGTYLASFRAVAKKYPHKAATEILSDLVRSTPGDEGKWFAAAKEAGLFDEALALASRTPCDPRTLTRAARDHAEKQPAFAVGAGLLAMHWLAEGYGYEVTADDVWATYGSTLAAAKRQGIEVEAKARIRKLLEAENKTTRFMLKVLGKEVHL
jgi:hypothetical protein